MKTEIQKDRESQQRKQALEQSLKDGVQALLSEVRAGRSDRLEALLAFSARFFRYSPRNQWLLRLQCTQRGITATHIASIGAWNTLHYAVKKGEQGLRIVVPCPRVTTNDEGEEEIRLSFKIASVFADPQVEPTGPDVPPIPTFFAALPDDREEIYRLLAQVVRSDGIELVEHAMVPQGYSAKGRIGIKAGLDSRNRVLTLIHEYAHELLHHRGELSAGKRECQAEAISYVVGQYCGVPNPYSADYLRQWGTDEQSLKDELEVVQATSATIIKKLEALLVPASTDGQDSLLASAGARAARIQARRTR